MTTVILFSRLDHGHVIFFNLWGLWVKIISSDSFQTWNMSGITVTDNNTLPGSTQGRCLRSIISTTWESNPRPSGYYPFGLTDNGTETLGSMQMSQFWPSTNSGTFLYDATIPVCDSYKISIFCNLCKSVLWHYLGDVWHILILLSLNYIFKRHS